MVRPLEANTIQRRIPATVHSPAGEKLCMVKTPQNVVIAKLYSPLGNQGHRILRSCQNFDRKLENMRFCSRQ